MTRELETRLPTFVSLTSIDSGPWFEPRHAQLADKLAQMVQGWPADLSEGATVAWMGKTHRLFRHVVPDGAVDALTEKDVDVRSLALVREALGYVSPMADSIFAVHGLGTFPVLKAGNAEQRQRLLERARTGDSLGAFALTEPEAGSDVAAMSTEARRTDAGYELFGEKIFISNATIADHFVVFATVDKALGRKGITAFLVEKSADGLPAGMTVEPQVLSVHHPIGRILFEGCAVPLANRLGQEGEGLKIALATLGTFRLTVGAAANGMATAALEDALQHVTSRKQFGKPLAEQQLVQGMLAEMATALDAARLMVARAAHRKDVSGDRAVREVAMAKLLATESAQRIIDQALQLHGGRGVVHGARIEALYRDIRPLRIYEGTSEIQKVIIARDLIG